MKDFIQRFAALAAIAGLLAGCNTMAGVGKDVEKLGAKIEQVLSLDYPHDKLEIIVASDGSTDRTDDVARQYTGSGVRLVRVEGRVLPLQRVG